MSKKRVGGKPCPAGKVFHPDCVNNPLLAQVRGIQAIMRGQRSDGWKLSDATVGNRRVLIGSGDVAARLPSSLPAWERSIGGKPLTKAQKRARKLVKKAAKSLAANVST